MNKLIAGLLIVVILMVGCTTVQPAPEQKITQNLGVVMTAEPSVSEESGYQNFMSGYKRFLDIKAETDYLWLAHRQDDKIDNKRLVFELHSRRVELYSIYKDMATLTPVPGMENRYANALLAVKDTMLSLYTYEQAASRGNLRVGLFDDQWYQGASAQDQTKSDLLLYMELEQN